MSSSTTHAKKQPTNGPNQAVEEEANAYQRELQKRIRNKNKKLETIKQLAEKIKNKEIKANEDQLSKIASMPHVEEEIKELKVQLELYAESVKEYVDKEKKMKKQHQKELHQTKKHAVTQVANMICMKLLQECDQPIQDEMKGGVSHFSDCLNKLLCRGQGKIEWKKNRDCFIACWTKLVNEQNDVIEHANTTYASLAEYVKEAILHGDYPDALECSNCSTSCNCACPKDCCNGGSKPQKHRKRNRSHKKEEEHEEEKKTTSVEHVEEPHTE